MCAVCSGRYQRLAASHPTSAGLTRKFWILLAFGAATYRAEHLHGSTSTATTVSWPCRFGHWSRNQLDGVDWAQIDGTMLPQLYRAGAPDEDER